MTTWQGLPPPPQIDPSIGNSGTILAMCISMYQTLWQQEYVVDRFLTEQLNWLLTTSATADFTPSSGVQQQVPSWYTINNTATASTNLVNQYQLSIYTLFTTSATTATIGNGSGGTATVPSYSQLTTTSNTALTNANAATTTANTAQSTANTAQSTANTAQSTANTALGNTNPAVYSSLSALQATTGIPNNTIALVQGDATVSNNTLYQLLSGTWTPINDRLSRALGNPLGYQASWSGSVLRTITSKLSALTNPEDAGAVGNGTTDCGAAFTASATNGRILVLQPGATYLINTSCTVGDIIPNGATIMVNAGVTFTFSSIIGDPSVPVFVPNNGTMGTVTSTTQYYSVGWFAGNDASTKWNYCTQGFVSTTKKTVYWPIPRSTDPAVATGADGITRWAITGVINFLSAHSNLTVIADGSFVVPTTAAVTTCFQFGSSTSVPGHITFSEGLYCDCNSTAGYGIQITTGNEITFKRDLIVTNATNSSFYVSNSNGTSSAIDIDTLIANNFTNYGLNINLVGAGTLVNTSPALTTFRIKTLITTGGKSGCLGLVTIAGSTNGVTIDNIIENISGTSSDWTGNMVTVTNTTYGTTTGVGVSIGTVSSLESARPILATLDSSSTAQGKIMVSVDQIRQTKNSGSPVNLDYCIASKIGVVNTGFQYGGQDTLITVSASCSNIDIVGTHYSAVNSVAPYTNFDGRIGISTLLANNTAVTTSIPNNYNSQEFSLTVPSVAKTYAKGWVDQTGSVSVQGIYVPGYTAPPTAGTFNTGITVFTAGSLNGTTGAVGAITISSVADTFYLENRSGGSQQICLLFN